ncbi:MAG TPA: tetratricopeptide repeat protein [Vicinamibacterales bacterium]|nr:tetratricopeptide repeat protein [Vicinamibacterales bacterium]
MAADIRFGPFTLDGSATRLERDGREIRLRPQGLLALRVLLRHAGKTVGYQQMIEEAWDGTIVSRHTVDVTIGEVRKSLGEFGTWIVNRPKLGHRIDVPTSDELVRRGWHFFNRRTREGFDRAIECFEQAAVETPSDRRSFIGLSESYLALATFGMRPPRDMYRRFLEAHARAVELGGLTPELRCDRAHALHLFERRVADAEAEFLKAIEDDSALLSAHIRLARLYAATRRTGEALDVLRRCEAIDPLLPLLPVTETLVHFWQRDYAAALAVGARAIELHPYLQVARANYAQALEFSGQLDEALAQYRTAIAMSPDVTVVRAHEGTCLAKLGRHDEALHILDAIEHIRRSEYVDAYNMAIFRDALGHRDAAFAELSRTFDDNSAWLFSLDVDPKFDGLRDDPRFERLRARLYIPAAVRSS